MGKAWWEKNWFTDRAGEVNNAFAPKKSDPLPAGALSGATATKMNNGISTSMPATPFQGSTGGIGGTSAITYGTPQLPALSVNLAGNPNKVSTYSTSQGIPTQQVPLPSVQPTPVVEAPNPTAADASFTNTATDALVKLAGKAEDRADESWATKQAMLANLGWDAATGTFKAVDNPYDNQTDPYEMGSPGMVNALALRQGAIQGQYASAKDELNKTLAQHGVMGTGMELAARNKLALEQAKDQSRDESQMIADNSGKAADWATANLRDQNTFDQQQYSNRVGMINSMNADPTGEYTNLASIGLANASLAHQKQMDYTSLANWQKSFDFSVFKDNRDAQESIRQFNEGLATKNDSQIQTGIVGLMTAAPGLIKVLAPLMTAAG